jgi:Cys-rich protein (TIGR01571 family)
MSQFNEALCGCLSGPWSCIVGWCIPGGYCLLQALAVKKSTNQGMLGPYLLPWLLMCIGAAINRGKVRETFKIEGNFFSDCLLHICCPVCAATQEYRETVRRKSIR